MFVVAILMTIFVGTLIFMFVIDGISNNKKREERVKSYSSKKHHPAVTELGKIIVRCRNMKDPLNQNYSGRGRYKIYFESRDKSFVKSIPLESEFIKKDSLNYYRWEARTEEYDRVYGNKSFYSYIMKDFSPIFDTVVQNEDDHQHLLNEYEDSFRTIVNSIEECMKYFGYTTQEVEEKSIAILEKFSSSVTEMEDERSILKEKLKEGTNKSIVDKLDFELDYLERND